MEITWEKIVAILVLIFSAVLHEVMHGAVAEKLGDPTARLAGRITLNPISHLDLFGSVILPLIFVLSGHPVYLAYAKPVPVDFYRLRNKTTGTILVSLAGPLTNLAIAIVAALLYNFGVGNAILTPILILTIVINLSLFTFNMLPIPPLDGGKVFFGLVFPHWLDKLFRYEVFGFLLLMLLVYNHVFDGLFRWVVDTFATIFAI